MSPHMVSLCPLSCFATDDMVKPFPLDYHQTLLSLLDILSEVYQKISRILGPSPFQLNSTSSSSTSSAGSMSTGAHMMGPLGLLSPHPGVSYLFSGIDASLEGGDSSLWGIVGGSNHNGVMLVTPWTAAMGEIFMKIDGKFKVFTITTIILTLQLMLRGFYRKSFRLFSKSWISSHAML
jgi:hypothetical protein